MCYLGLHRTGSDVAKRVRFPLALPCNHILTEIPITHCSHHVLIFLGFWRFKYGSKPVSRPQVGPSYATPINWSTPPMQLQSKPAPPDEGKPADRTYFAPGYYAANVADFDGNLIEFVHKAWNPKRHSKQSQPQGSESRTRVRSASWRPAVCPFLQRIDSMRC